MSQYPNSNIVDEGMLDHSEAELKEIDEREKVQCSPNKTVVKVQLTHAHADLENDLDKLND